ncbi:hypothetical protein IQ216_08115 [Cyanobium sp. LEGE 06143]|uniref:hypothetical protein n=1 Tax=unclassified Cyanobium TaxID=2627006 RepID=UPI001644EA85|nr:MULTISPECIES: hypothetical protein [unclassified Cyanobium]MBE9152643.1 hypothetical protein [Cyanobium sp. LEGE 06113]MBE9153152.1 hypothetical protein [Cyanobium sp. LEGE 06113]MBE9173048.1 hypothetical protein [Cyanobium sp. LEGE 06143]QNI71417.1 putative conserved membrane protein [Cyanobium sp. NS01]
MFFHPLPPPYATVLPLVMLVAVVALVAWALQLMQAANDRQEFSLMLAGCMVCSAAVGLATVTVIMVTAPQRLPVLSLESSPPGGVSLDAVSLPEMLPDSLVFPWDGQL